MDYANKPTAFILGKKKKDAPEMKPMTKEEMRFVNTCPRIKRNEIERLSDIHTELSFSFQCSQTNCSNPKHFNEYLRNALSEYRSGKGTTFVMCEYIDDQLNAILGFISLKASSYLFEGESGKLQGYPAIEVAELAIAEGYTGQGLGTALLDYAFFIANELRSQVGVRYLVACADSHALGFYVSRRNRFEKCAAYHEIPREPWNEDCVPVAKMLPEVGLISFISDEEDDEESDDSWPV